MTHHEEVAQLAYGKFQRRQHAFYHNLDGVPLAETALDDWLKAERELNPTQVQ